MWTCPYCGEKEPLEFQRGHIDNCKARKALPIPVNCVPAPKEPVVILGVDWDAFDDDDF